MRFSCGETWESKEARLSEWHPFFALFPRTFAIKDGRHQCVWLETIERKGKYHSGYDGGWWRWEYRVKENK